MNQTKANKQLSIRTIFLLTGIGLLVVSLSGVSMMIYANWHGTIVRGAQVMSEGVSRSIGKQLDKFVRMPVAMNAVTQKLIISGMADMQDESDRFKTLLSLVTTHEQDVYTVGYAMPEGAYYAVSRRENGNLEYICSDAHSGGRFWSYAITEDMTLGQLTETDRTFDPRERVWYQSALQAGGPVFSPVYEAFRGYDLSISASHPIYDEEDKLSGVLTTNLMLSDIGNSLRSISASYDGYAFVTERDTGLLIANSLGAKNYSVAGDGQIKRHTPEALNPPVMGAVYRRYLEEGKSSFIFSDQGEAWYVKVQTYSQSGFDWLSFSMYPESRMAKNFSRSVMMTAFFVLGFGLLFLILYTGITRWLFRPVYGLLEAAGGFSRGDLTVRAPVKRDDEVGALARIFNDNVAQIRQLVTTLEDTVAQRTEALHEANELLGSHRNQLRLILDSTAEGIFGVDLQGICTFCNRSALRMLGYRSAMEVQGKDMCRLIHHSRRDGTPIPENERPLVEALFQKVDSNPLTDIFWRADGAFFDVEIRGLPQFQDGENVGYVITFSDVTNRKRAEERIQYLSRHDSLTGLLNRRSFEEEVRRLDVPESLPLAVVFMDLNGLKFLNDVFGHAFGDELIETAAMVMEQGCPADSVVARVGGDEFAILLPRTQQEEAQRLAEGMKAELTSRQVAGISCSMAVGAAVKKKMTQSIPQVLKHAEGEMYKEKNAAYTRIGADAIRTIIALLHERSPREKRHSEQVRRLCRMIGRGMKLPEADVKALGDAGYLHDIGKIALPEQLLNKPAGQLTEAETEQMRQHPATGFRILNLSGETLDLAQGVYGHHECWDGSGYPKGLRGTEIPFCARAIAVAEVYSQKLGQENTREAKEKALQAVSATAGMTLDPDIAGLFCRIMACETEADGKP